MQHCRVVYGKSLWESKSKSKGKVTVSWRGSGRASRRLQPSRARTRGWRSSKETSATWTRRWMGGMGRGRGGGLRWMALREGTGRGIDSGSGCGSGRRAVQRSDLVKQDPAYSRPAASKCQTLEDGQKLSLSPHQHDSCMVLLRHQPPLIFGLWSKDCTQVTLSYTQIPLAITHGSVCHTDLQTKVTSFIHPLKESRSG
jgi:hypothetical protein